MTILRALRIREFSSLELLNNLQKKLFFMCLVALLGKMSRQFWNYFIKKGKLLQRLRTTDLGQEEMNVI